jgi:D-glycerate 3-kinase
VAAAREGGGGGDEGYAGRLGYVQLCDVEVVNAALGEYEALTEMLDVFVHLDALEVGSVYGWRMEQERELWAKKGEGMSEEGVRKFVDGYYPAYELYLDGVRDGVFQAEGAKGKGRQVRLVVDGKRAVVRWEVL